MLTIKRDSGRGTELHYSVKDAAQVAGVSRQWLHTLINRGTVKAGLKWSGRRWVPESEIQRIKVLEVNSDQF